ncbi:hypothetical protein MACK_003237 [Theileria orientalis]|uniref:Uncharacterized protein n=1 Tax=Theileria orientalis TaxID=68886 RepID=A0A976SID5_THEOR|nr:hypothetical protein MACK_003237 [Theileria orientalis]
MNNCLKYRIIINIIVNMIFIHKLSEYGECKVNNTIMLELGSLPNMNEMLPNEEPPNLADYDEPIVTKKTTLENFPNPFMNPIECNRINVEESYICDPDKILKTSEADRIDELLSLERLSSTHHCEGYGEVPYKIGIGIINSIAKEDFNTLADELLERWKLSHERCYDGILLLFTKQEPDVLIKYDKGVEPYLSPKVISTIYPMCQTLLQNEKLAIAIEKCNLNI